MYRFTNDYSEAAHPALLEAIATTSQEGNFGYGCDPYTQKAAQMIIQLCKADHAQVHFLVGGTQTNMTAISAFLRPHQAAIAADSGHICVHETGAIESTGHKCIAMPTANGKLTPALVRQAVQQHPDEHMVQPKLVYISNTTENGGIYTTQELKELRRVCDELGLFLYLDGARLGSALAAGATTLPDLAQTCHAFYIGGTKNGALFGEALVIVEPTLQQDFRYMIKQRGGLLAKGWLLGVQFIELMKNDMQLYLGLANHANDLALQLKRGIAECGYGFYSDSNTNQQFPILPNEVLEKLRGRFHWEEMGAFGEDKTIIRLVTSWATKQQAVDAFLEALKTI